MVQRQNEIRFAITEAYFSSLFQVEKLKIAQQNIERVKSNLEYIKTRFSLGVALKNDLDKQQLELSNAELSLRKAQQDYDFSLVVLKYQMQIDPESPIEINEKISNFSGKTEAIIPNNSTQNITDLQLEKNSMLLNQLQAEKISKWNKPTVSAYGNVSVLALNENISPFSYVGVRASLPIYDGKQAKLSAEEYKIRQQINQLNVQKITADLDFKVKNAQKNLKQAQFDLEETQKNIALAKQIYDTDLFRFEQGNIVQSEVKNSAYNLNVAENNYLTALYNVLLVQLELKKISENW